MARIVGKLVAMVMVVGALSRSAPARAQESPPSFTDVSDRLCATYRLSGEDCVEQAFATPQPVVLVEGREPGWIYVSLRGAESLCYVRHVCFALVQRRAGRWRVVLESVGSTLAISPARHPDRMASLVVSGSNSAEEFQATRYRWRRGRYRPTGSQSCRYARPLRGLCRAAERGALPLQ